MTLKNTTSFALALAATISLAACGGNSAAPVSNDAMMSSSGNNSVRSSETGSAMNSGDAMAGDAMSNDNAAGGDQMSSDNAMSNDGSDAMASDGSH